MKKKVKKVDFGSLDEACTAMDQVELWWSKSQGNSGETGVGGVLSLFQVSQHSHK